MKTTTNNLFNEISTTQLEQLTKQVKETVATEYKSHSKIFSSADLWDIQRRRKTIFQRRNLM